jgi:hypothetical protein
MGLWSETHAATIDPERFRAHNQYLWQPDDYPYVAMVDWVYSNGLESWIHQLGEDGSFGCVTENVDGVVVSRDLLDSITEIHFLRECLGDKWLKGNREAVDIGAGYGRLVHRMSVLYPNVYLVATDKIPQSLDVCRRYLRYRGMGPSWVCEPSHLLPGPYDLACNIHSWSECTYEEVSWWLRWLDAVRCRYVFIVPHDPGLHTWQNGEHNRYGGPSYRPLLERYGYKLVHNWGGPECNQKRYMLWERQVGEHG